MTRMIVCCAACSAQNFVSEERRKAAEIPPCCWKCSGFLPAAAETDPPEGESNKGIGSENRKGGARNG
ncbi:MAG TPA: hypothetical protein DD658_05660 [Deltaproteobacteria bacterium]|nr:MAG: hypothetical protein A2X88_00995 [Deltaproteobacteria bacterium GWC2_65_14]HBO69638.1 hypothetical protein [Deltaproteobacteria bacterium]